MTVLSTLRKRVKDPKWAAFAFLLVGGGALYFKKFLSAKKPAINEQKVLKKV
jgi:hypothetical protein